MSKHSKESLLHLSEVFPSFQAYLDWLGVWFPDEAKEVEEAQKEIRSLDDMSGMYMKHFYWPKIRFQKSCKVPKAPTLHKLDGNWQ